MFQSAAGEDEMVTVTGTDLNIKHVALDHLLTEHGLQGCDATRFGWERKSKWYGDESQIADFVTRAFDAFRQAAIATVTVTLNQDANGRSVVNQDIREQVGTGLSGKPTTWVRLVLEVKHSGDCTIVTAFPL